MRRVVAIAAAALSLAAVPAADAFEVTEFPIPGTADNPGGVVPTGIAAGPDGNLYFSTRTNFGQFFRITPAGAITGFAPSVPDARAPRIVTGPTGDGRLWATNEDAAPGRFLTVRFADGFQDSFPSPGSLPTNGIVPHPDGNLWFTQSAASAVGHIATDGSLTPFPLPAPARAPDDITVAPDRSVWFTMPATNNVGRMTVAGLFSQTPLPTGPAGPPIPAGITTGLDGNMWVSLPQNASVARITPAGVVTEFPLGVSGANPEDGIAGPDGAVWFGDGASPRLYRVSADGTPTAYDLPAGTGAVEDMAAGPDGAIWYTRTGTNRIGRFRVTTPPVLGQTVAVEPAQGTVLVRRRGSRRFVRLGAKGASIKVGSEVDVRKGRVRLTAAKGAADRTTKTMNFFGGRFTVAQLRRGAATVTAKLSGPLECGGSSRYARRKKGRRVWGDGKGDFSTSGKNGKAIVRGTIWLTEDRCDGSTRYFVKQGVIEVTANGRKVRVRAGKSLVVRPR